MPLFVSRLEMALKKISLQTVWKQLTFVSNYHMRSHLAYLCLPSLSRTFLHTLLTSNCSTACYLARKDIYTGSGEEHEDDWFSERPEDESDEADSTKTKYVHIRKPQGSNEDYVRFLEEKLSLSQLEAISIVKKHPDLVCVPFTVLQGMLTELYSLKYTTEDIAKNSKVLLLSALSVRRRYTAFSEIGFKNITLNMLITYKAVFNCKSAKPKDRLQPVLNLLEMLGYDLNYADTLTEKYPELKKGSLYTARKILRREYLKERLQCTEDEEKVFSNCYTRTNLTVIKENLDLLLNDIGFSTQQIKRNKYLLDIKTENAKLILQRIPVLLGPDSNLNFLLRAYPKILYQSIESLEETIKCLTDAGITTEQICNCANILTLKPSTVKERIQNLAQFPDFELMKKDIKYVKLIHHYNKVTKRLQQMQDLNYLYMSLTMLISAESVYRRTLEKGWNSGSLLQAARFISAMCDVNEKTVKELLSEQSRHNRLVNPVNTKAVMEFLFSKGVTKSQFLCAVGIVQYDLQIVEQHFYAMHDMEELEPFDDWWNHPNLVHLLIYLIERDMGYIDLEHSKFEKFTPACTFMPGVANYSEVQEASEHYDSEDGDRDIDDSGYEFELYDHTEIDSHK